MRVTLRATPDSGTPFQVDDWIRHVPWSKSRSCLASSLVEALAAPSGVRDPEQAVVLSNARVVKTSENDFIFSPFLWRAGLRERPEVRSLLPTNPKR